MIADPKRDRDSEAHRKAMEAGRAADARAQRADEKAAHAAADVEQVEFVRFDHILVGPGGVKKLACVWPADANKLRPEFARWWRVIDGSTQSATTLAARIVGEMEAALTDENLSPTGRRAAVKAILGSAGARSSMEAMGARWIKAREDDAKEAGELAGIDRAYSANQPWRWAFDLETARAVREFDADRRRSLALALALGEHADLAESLLRVPAHLSGMTSMQLMRIERRRIEDLNPGHGHQRELVRQATLAAADAINALCGHLESGLWVDAAELRSLWGPNIAAARQFARENALASDVGDNRVHAAEGSDEATDRAAAPL